jgi:hypothetical protein
MISSFIVSILAQAGAENSPTINYGQLIRNIMQYSVIIIPVALIFIYKIFSKKLKHKQVMAAIEKGVLVPKTGRRKGPRWIRSTYMGILLLVISCVFVYLYLEPLIHGRKPNQQQFLLFIMATLSISMALLVRGILLRKSQIKALALEKGLCFTEIFPPRPKQFGWIICLAIGLPLALLGTFFFSLMVIMVVTGSMGGGITAFVICTVPFVVGWAFLLSGLMLRKVMSKPPVTETPANC